MRGARSSSRSATGSGLGTSTSAVIALVALAAAITSIQSVAHGRIGPADVRTAASEAPTVRAVAAAVAAAARELVGGGERVDVALPPTLLAQSLAPSVSAAEPPQIRVRLQRSAMIPERLLDLPPPVC